ncbi:hypothetical protein [Lentzea sp.]|uniref:hypothetical protein n=1 Tax=Lentzea sp. TaxID=56099 RepID=UPI002ED26C10
MTAKAMFVAPAAVNTAASTTQKKNCRLLKTTACPPRAVVPVSRVSRFVVLGLLVGPSTIGYY